jgi:hypothetical protein
MRPLVIGPDEIASLAKVKAHAEAHRFNLDEVSASVREGRPIATDRGFRCALPVGFQVAFSIEQHPDGWMRHLSVSIPDAPGRLPSSHAMAEIGRALGMRMDIFDPSAITRFWPEPPADPQEIAVFEPINPPGPTEDAPP